MEKLFKELHEYLDAQYKQLAAMPAPDAVFGVGDVVMGLTDIINAFQTAAFDTVGEDQDEGIAATPVVVSPAPKRGPDMASVTRAVLLGLSLRDDLEALLSKAGLHDEASVVAAVTSTAVLTKGAKHA